MNYINNNPTRSNFARTMIWLAKAVAGLLITVPLAIVVAVIAAKVGFLEDAGRTAAGLTRFFFGLLDLLGTLRSEASLSDGDRASR